VWLRHCATSQDVEVSNTDNAITFLNRPNPYSLNETLKYTQPLTEMNIGNLPGG
jgi:hypothetical protein